LQTTTLDSAVGYQPTLSAEMGSLQERITSTKELGSKQEKQKGFGANSQRLIRQAQKETKTG